MRGARRILATVAGVFVGCIVIFVLVEGLSSAFLFGWDFAFKARGGLHSRRHVQFDAELGWINTPSVRHEALFGPGRDLTTDAHSLRTTREESPKPPAGKRRILCTGDSFTLGFGNDDEEAWCRLLELRHEHVQTLNAGEAGYGLDQMYLKTQRLAKTFAWDVNVFVFVADDIRRMTTLDFVGRNKPRARLKDGELSFEGSPVERSSDLYTWFRANKGVFGGLRFLELTGRFQYKLNGPPPPPMSDEETLEIAGTVLEAMARANRARGAETVFVFIPSQAHFDWADAKWRPEIQAECARRGLHAIDLVAPARDLDDPTEDAMYDPEWAHYTAGGNAWIANQMWNAMLEVPELKAKLQPEAEAASPMLPLQ